MELNNQLTNKRKAVRAAHAAWSDKTFGSVGPIGPLKHLSKEALEAAAAPGDLSEWADMQFLLWDAQRRAGITDEQITQALVEKLAVNESRDWPEPKDGEPRFHVKSNVELQEHRKAATEAVTLPNRGTGNDPYSLGRNDVLDVLANDYGPLYVAPQPLNDAERAELQEYRKATAPQLPDVASFEVNDAAWKLHDMLRAHGPITGAQFNNMKGCFYEALKVAMKKSIATAQQSLNDAERTNIETVVAGSIFFSSPEDLARAIAAVRCFDELSPELIAEEMFKGGAA